MATPTVKLVANTGLKNQQVVNVVADTLKPGHAGTIMQATGPVGPQTKTYQYSGTTGAKGFKTLHIPGFTAVG